MVVVHIAEGGDGGLADVFVLEARDEGANGAEVGGDLDDDLESRPPTHLREELERNADEVAPDRLGRIGLEGAGEPRRHERVEVGVLQVLAHVVKRV